MYTGLLRRRPFGLSRTREDALRDEPKPWAWFLKGNLRARVLFFVVVVVFSRVSAKFGDRKMKTGVLVAGYLKG